jgi:hypothetical protein
MLQKRDSSRVARFHHGRLFLVTMAVLLCLVAVSAAFGAGRSSFVVHSTLDGKKALPHRIMWTADPRSAHSQVITVDFLIDGKQDWVEHATPFTYGGNGNYLVTSFLKPGLHTFTVKAINEKGQQASNSVKAKVSAAPAPPAKLAGTWKAFRPGGGGGPPAGYWRLTINSVGWRFIDTSRGGDSFDVTYPSPGVLRVGTGLMTGTNESIEGNGWCNEDAGKPAKYHWTIHSSSLAFTWLSGSHQCGFSSFLTQKGHAWKRIG